MIMTVLLVGNAWGAGEKEGASSGPVVLDFVNWATAEEQTRIRVEGLIAKFEAENPGIKINSITSGFSDILNQLTVMQNAGDAPDIAQAAGVNVSALYMMGALEPVDKLFSQELQDDFFDSMYDLLVYDGKHYGVPWGGASFGFQYNRDLMIQAGLDPNNPPKTFVEFQNAVRKARKALPESVVIMGLDTSMRVFGFEHNYPFLLAADADPFLQKPLRFDTPAIKAYLEWLREAARGNYTLANKKLGEFRPIAAQGRLLFMFDQQHIKGTVKSLNPALTDEEFNRLWGVVTMPANAAGIQQTTSADHQLVVFKDSPHKKEAAKFVEFLVNSDYAIEKYIKVMGMTPTKSGIKRFPEYLTDPILSGFINDVIPSVVPVPYGQDFSELALIFMSGVQDAMTGNKSIDEITSDMQAKVERIR